MWDLSNQEGEINKLSDAGNNITSSQGIRTRLAYAINMDKPAISETIKYCQLMCLHNLLLQRSKLKMSINDSGLSIRINSNEFEWIWMNLNGQGIHLDQSLTTKVYLTQ